MSTQLTKGKRRKAAAGEGSFWGSLRLGGFFLEFYLFKEMIRPFFLGVAGGAVMMLGNQLFIYADLLVKKGAPPLTILHILLLNLPAILVVTFPIAALFATLLTLGRMGADSEMTALRAAGIPYRKVLIPLLCIGLLISGLALFTHEVIVPQTNQKVKTLNTNLILAQDALPFNPGEVVRVDSDLWFHVGSMDPKTGLMQDLLILDRKAETGHLRYPQVISAQRAQRVGQVWHLQGVVIRRYDEQGRTYYEGHVAEMELNIVNQLVGLVYAERVPQEQRAAELWEQCRRYRKEQRPAADVARCLTEYHLKFAIPLASFFAILVAAPLGLQTVRQTGRYGSVALAIVLVFVYYVLMSLGRAMGRVGYVDPWLAAWLPNMIFGGVSLGLLWRFLR
jgi:lipopolysaccharide export system permease protein